MDALINLKDCKEYMTITLNGREHQVKLAGTVDIPYFCGKDVCEVLGYESPKFALQRHVDDEDKTSLHQMKKLGDDEDKISLKELLEMKKVGSSNTLNYHKGKAVYINKRGLQQLISKSKVCGPDQLQQIVDAFDVQLLITPRKEHLHLEAIEKTFSKVKMYKQFKVGRYKVDLYIEEYNLVVECDEHDHYDRDPREERERECFIKSELGCEFIRFNPDSKNFSIFGVLGEIHQYILKILLLPNNS